MDSFQFPQVCAVCGGAASIWCYQDAASLCRSCDENVHTTSLLARSHTRVALPRGQRTNPAPPSQPQANECRPDSAADLIPQAHQDTVDELLPRPSAYSICELVCPVPDIFSGDDELYAEKLTGHSSKSLELCHVEAEPLIFGEQGLEVSRKPDSPSHRDSGDGWGSSFPGCPFGSLPEDTELIAHIFDAPAVPTDAPAASLPAPAPPEAPQPVDQSSIETVEQHSQPLAGIPTHSFASAAATAPAPGMISAAAIGPMVIPWGPQPGCASPYMAPFPAPGMAFVQHAAPWLSYLPVSLQPRPPADEEATAQHATARGGKLARFRRKKLQFSLHKAVRYENRKRYADSRPRKNGRFISKTDGAREPRVSTKYRAMRVSTM